MNRDQTNKSRLYHFIHPEITDIRIRKSRKNQEWNSQKFRESGSGYYNLEKIPTYRGSGSDSFPSRFITLSSLRNRKNQLYIRGRIAESKQNLGQAIRFYQESLSIDTTYFKSLLRLGNAFLETNEIVQAEKCFRNAIGMLLKFYSIASQ